MYFDASTKDVIPVCAKPDCKHDDYDCNSYLGKGEYLLFSVYYYNGYVYVLKNNMGNAQLVQIKLFLTKANLLASWKNSCAK